MSSAQERESAAQPWVPKTTVEGPVPRVERGSTQDWPLHNFDLRSSRFAPLDQINVSNVTELALKWSFETERGTSIRSVDYTVVNRLPGGEATADVLISLAPCQPPSAVPIAAKTRPPRRPEVETKKYGEGDVPHHFIRPHGCLKVAE